MSITILIKKIVFVIGLILTTPLILSGQKITIEKIIEDVNKIKVPDGYRIDGGLNVDTLGFNNVLFGDIMHYVFVDSSGNEIDFGINNSNMELEVNTDDYDHNGGYAPNKLYLYKPFLVIWRQLTMTKKPEDFIDEYYLNVKEIIYLKKI